MRFRKLLFWTHLAAGLIAGLAIGVMCFTGVTLAFEKQLVAWSERDARQVTPPSPDAAQFSLDDILARVRAVQPDARPSAITLSADPRQAVTVSFGRDQAIFVNPYTGEPRQPASTAMHDFLHTMENWHRVLAFSGDQRPLGKLINGVCNLAFCALAVTGLYLWLPRSWSWRSVRAIAVFNGRLTGKARDFNWHNAIGLWSAPILIVLTLTAVPISFRWGNALVYRLVGEAPPVQAGPPGSAASAIDLPKPAADAHPLALADQFAAVQNAFPAWEQITLRLASPARGATPSRSPAAPGSAENTARGPRADRAATPSPANFSVKLPDAWPRTATTTVILNPFSGEILRQETFADQTTGRQVRTWTRFLHTGEALGWIGQLMAGLACLGGCFLVYTGFALSWRRFFGKKPVARAQT